MKVREDQMTPWFPGDVKPARPGFYQRNLQHKFIAAFSIDHFDGKQWFKTIGRQVSPYPALIQTRPWRGLNFNPEA